MNWLFLAPFGAASLHIVEEFVYPGGFAAWDRAYRPGIRQSITPRFHVIVNGLLLVACYDVFALRSSPMAAGAWLAVTTLLFANAIWHVVGSIPGHLGIVVTHVGPNEVRAELLVRKALMAPNGYLHAGTVVTLADTAAGYGCLANLPPGASGFTTIELKSNHMGTARDGTIACHATAVHRGRTTQVWDSVVTHRETGKTIALFRCTQMVLYAASTGV